MAMTTKLFRASLLAGSIAALAIFVGCGDDGGGATIDGPPGGGQIDGPPGSGGDGGGGTVDGMPGTNGDGGMTGVTQCTNGIDDDMDGKTDGEDPECVSAEDNDEGSFATGIPGDNKDAVKQDCFFDGDSGSGQYGCDIHVCCLLDDPDTTEHECPGDLMPDKYDPDTSCEVPQSCIDFCLSATPPGCDCFGCCTIYDENNVGHDVLLEPGCSTDDLSACQTCTKVDACSNDCEVSDGDCILCPGEDPSDLPETCGGQNECPEGYDVCDPAAPNCADGQYCYNGCCTGVSPE